MTAHLPWIIAGMVAVTYIPRLLPLVLRGGRAPRPWQSRMLRLVPFAAIGALIFPGAFGAVEGSLVLSLIGLGAAGITASVTRQPFVVVAVAVLSVVVAQLLGLSPV